MQQRMNPFARGHRGIKALFGLGAYLNNSSLEQSLLLLIYLRVSQMNGCAYCLDMHSKDLRVLGESEQRVYLVSAWREVDLYSGLERAALSFAEALTKIDSGVPAEIYDELTNYFTEDEIIDLTLAVATINTYNRINITFCTKAGDYQPGQHAAVG